MIMIHKLSISSIPDQPEPMNFDSSISKVFLASWVQNTSMGIPKNENQSK